MLNAILSLESTPCKEIIFMGSAGSLNEKINIGDIVIPEYSVSCVGADRYLTTSKLSQNDSFGAKCYSDTNFSKKLTEVINAEIKDTDIKIHKGYPCSIESIFCEYANVEELINLGYNAVEMETSTFFAASKVANLKAAAILDISDVSVLSSQNKTMYSGRTEEDKAKKYKVKNEIIPKVILKMYNN